MRPDAFATQPLPPRDQFAAWREWYRPVFDVIPKNGVDDAFPAEVHVWRLGGLAISRSSAPPRDVVRTKTHLRHDPVDHWIISYCARGAHSAVTAGTVLEVPARVPYLWSLGQEFLHERTHVDRVQFFLARDGRLSVVTEADLSRLTTAVGAMVAAALSPSADRVAVARGQIDVGRKERVRQAVRRHLRTPTLGPTNLCRLVGMSRSNLYRLFEDTGGVARYIQRERLLEAHAVLTDPTKTQSISAIAEDLCFAYASSFSRTFRREFGHSPSEVRSAALAGLAPSAMPRSPAPSAGADFGELIREF